MLVAKRKIEEEVKVSQWGVNEQKEYEARKKYRRVYSLTTKILNLDTNLIQTAVKSLQHHNKITSSKEENILSLDDEYIILCITLSRSVPENNPLPIQIDLKHPINSTNSSVCIMFDKLEPEILKPMKNSKLLSNVKLRDYESFSKVHLDKGKFAQFADSFNKFFCEKEFYNKLPKIYKEFLGKRNKCPYPLTIKEERDIANVITKEYLTIRKAGKFEVRVASTSIEVQKSVRNIVSAIYQIVPHILLRCGKHTSVTVITLKTKISIELPIYKAKSSDDK